MSYIGKTPIVGNFQKCDAITVVNGQAAYTLQVSSANVIPESANHMLVSLNGILQAPVTSFTVSGSTLTFASNLATGDVIDFVILLGNVLDLGTPSDGTVTNAKLAQDIISGETALTSAPADTDEFLVSDAGTLKRIDYSLIKGGGCWEKILTTTIENKDDSGPATVDFSSTYITTTYLDYMIIFSGAKPQTNNTSFEMLFSVDGGSSFLTTSDYWYGILGRGADGSTDTVESAGTSEFTLLNEGVGEDSTAGGIIELYDPMNQSSDEKYPMATWRTVSRHGAGGRINNSYGGGVYKGSVTAVYNGIRLQPASGDWELGVFTLYGRKT